MKLFGYLFAGLVVFSMIIGAPKAVQTQKKEEIKEVTISATLHCKSCQNKVEREIAFEKGVKSVTTNLEEKTVTIKYEASNNTDEKLAEALKKLGYEVKILKDEEKVKK